MFPPLESACVYVKELGGDRYELVSTMVLELQAYVLQLVIGGRLNAGNGMSKRGGRESIKLCVWMDICPLKYGEQ